MSWVVIWRSFSPSIPTADRKLRATSSENRQDFEDQKSAVYFVVEKLKADEQQTVHLHGAGTSFDLENIKAMFATYKQTEN